MNPAKSQLCVGLDAGSSRTRCVITVLEGDHLRAISYGLAPSMGWVKGRINDQEAVAHSIREAVHDAERGAGVSVEAITIGIGGSSIRGAQGRDVYGFGRPREIEAGDLAYAVEMASDVSLERDRMLLHVLPQDFTLDGRPGFRKPIRSVCTRLEANVHLITGSTQEHHALVAAAHTAHLAVEETVFEPLAASYACVMPDERMRGVAVVDLGLDSTGMVVYDGDRLVLAANVPVTSDHLTRDIAWMFKIAYEDAESLKQQYGCAIMGLSAESTLIEVPSPEGRAPREARRAELIEILEARADQLFTYVRTEIQRSGMDRNLLEGVILTGAGALLPGMWDMAERKLDCPACHGMAKGIGDWPDELASPTWATAAGLAMYSAKLKLRRPPQRRAGGLMGLITR
ncbi:MAG: cell division protein FtsA [Acidobacteriota bacterium]